MIKFLIILAVIWTILSSFGWICLFNMMKSKSQAEKQKLVSNIYGWSIALDVLTVSFWIWLAV